jgi:hypothetical protein
MSNSKKITIEECSDIARLMERKYAGYLNGRTFKVESNVAADGVYGTISLQDDSRSFMYPVEGRVKYREQDLTVHEAALILFDYIDLYFEEYLKADSSVFLPIDWCDYSLEEIDLQLRGQIMNKKIEEMGDDWLAGKGLEDLH